MTCYKTYKMASKPSNCPKIVVYSVCTLVCVGGCMEFPMDAVGWEICECECALLRTIKFKYYCEAFTFIILSLIFNYVACMRHLPDIFATDFLLHLMCDA